MEERRVSLKALNWLNFFAADVSTGIGPFLAVYLSANRHWNAATIGYVISAMSFGTVICQSPAGYITDHTNRKRYILVMVSVVMGVVGFTIKLFPVFSVVMAAQIVMGIAAAFFIPVLIALAQGITGPQKFDQVISRNQTYNHAGNVVAAVLIGVLGRFTNNEGVFYIVVFLSLMACISVLKIREKDIDHNKAREAGEGDGQKNLPVRDILKMKPLLIFLFISFLFHFANAAMLPLVGQQLSHGKKDDASLYMAACIILAQLVMTPVAFFSGRFAVKGRKYLLMIGFIALPVRGVLYTLNANPYYLVSVQILDGIAAGIFSVVSILVISDLLKGSGRSNLGQGILAAAVGLGATLSNVTSGIIVTRFSYQAGFLSLAALALVALGLLWFAMPETLQREKAS